MISSIRYLRARRARTDLPPLAPSGWSEDLESRLQQSRRRLRSGAFTRELCDARALNRWRATALAMITRVAARSSARTRESPGASSARDAERAGSSPLCPGGEGAALLERRLASLR